MKSKGIKIPLELVDLINSLNPDDKAPGEVLLNIVKDYVRLIEYAKTLNNKNLSKISVSDAIINYYSDQDARIEEIQKSQRELMRMLDGLEIFFKKVKK